MKYVLLIYRDEVAGAKASPGDLQKEGAAYDAFTKSIKESGNFLDGDPFEPTGNAQTVEVRGGKTQSRKGPARHGQTAARGVLQGRGEEPRGGSRDGLADPRGHLRIHRGPPGLGSQLTSGEPGSASSARALRSFCNVRDPAWDARRRLPRSQRCCRSSFVLGCTP
jgi:hypothetical protein